MEENIGTRKKLVSKVFVTMIALTMIVPIGLMISIGESPEVPMAKQAPVLEDFYLGNTQIKLAAAQFDVNVGPQGLVNELCIEEYSDRVDGYYIVQFNDVSNVEWKAILSEMGARIGTYVPYNAYMVKMSAEVKIQVENLDFVQYVGIYQPEYKISKSLLVDQPLQSDLIVEDALAFINWENLWQKARVIGQGNAIPVTISIHPNENSYNVAALIGKTGGNVLEISDTSVRAVVSLEGVQVLSFLNDVQYISPYYSPAMHLATANVWEQAKAAGQYPAWDEGLHGEGIIVATSDTGLDTDHEMFIDPLFPGPPDWTGWSGPGYPGYPSGHRKVVRYEQWTDDVIDDAASQHGTHTASYPVGNGDYVGGTNVNRFGMAYEGKISFHDIGDSADTLSGIPSDLKDMFQIQYDDGARLTSNSWGVHTINANGDRTLSEGKYSEDSMNSDMFMWQNPEFLIFFSAGNDRTSPAADRPDLYPYPATVTPPSTGKNMVCVGAHNSGAGWNNMEGYSSFGPTLSRDYVDSNPADYFDAFVNGRLKPDICSDGAVFGATGDHNRNGAEDNSYSSMSGTSTSGPVCMGATALITQYYKDGFYPVTSSGADSGNGFEPSAALVKATLLNGAVDASSGSGSNSHPYVLNGHSMIYPNNDQGWGMTDVGNSLYFWGDAREMEVDDNTFGLLTDDYREYKFDVAAGQPLEISLVWTDYPGSQATMGSLVNDLNLTVTDPLGVEHWGNNYGGATRETDGNTHSAGRDTVNNVECVLDKTPSPGIWTINVRADAVQIGPQPYALVVTGNFADGYGWVKLDKSVYAKGDTVNIEVIDIDLSVPPYIVNVLSSTTDSATVTLTEVGHGRFTGSIDTAVVDLNATDGLISIEDDGWIEVSYVDSSPSHTSYAIASTDLSGPMIWNVTVTDISNTAAVVRWKTDVAATSQVYYGETPALGSTSPFDKDMARNHAMALTGLNAFTDYYFDVESVSIGGVTTRDTNGQTHYMFTTVDDPDVLIIQEHSDLESSEDQVNDWRLSLDHFGWSYTVWETVKYGLPSVAALNSAKLVYWDVGEGYPQLGSDERAVIQTWNSQIGQQLWYQTGQDVGWDMCDPAGTSIDVAWYEANLHARYRRDDADGGGGNEAPPPFQIVGTAHAISNIFPGNGVGQDLEQDVYGAGRFWPDDLTNDRGGMVPAPWDYNRHAGGGDCGGSTYSGVDFRVANEGFAHAQIQDDGTYVKADFGVVLNMDRALVADYTLQWLFGEDHPDVHVVSPDGGETLTGTAESITWTIANAISIDVLISRDGGQSYVIEATGLGGGTTNYVWDTTTSGSYGPGLDFPNGDHYRVKIMGYGSNLKGFDVSDANFTVFNGPSGDDLGPIIWAGSVTPSPIPVERNHLMHITAIADDSMKGNSNILTVEYYIDGTTAGELIGNMNPVDVFDSALEGAEIDYLVMESLGTHTIYVRARDFASNWGGFESIDFEVIQGPNTPPWVTLTTPDGGEVWMGGAANDIIWDMGDDQDSLDQLTVDLYYSENSGATFPNTIATGLNGFLANPCTYSWDPTPFLDLTTVQVRIVVTDTGLYTAEDDSVADFEIDSTAPAPATNVLAELVATHVEVYWDPSVSPDVHHYEVYYVANNWDPTGDTYNFLADKGLLLSHLHSNVGIMNPSSYFYQIRTYDEAGHETKSPLQAAKTGSTQSFLQSEWFMLGSFLVQSDTSWQHVIQGALLPANMDYLQLYDPWDAADPWKTYSKYTPISVNDLTDITNTQGFWMHVTGNSRFATAGYVEDMAISLKIGWNLVAYPFAVRQTTTANIDIHLSANCPGYDSMMIADYGAAYRVTTPTGGETLLHGSAIWVKVSFDTVWTVTNY